MLSHKQTIRFSAFFALLLALVVFLFRLPGQLHAVLADAPSGHWVEGFGRGVLHGGIWEMVADDAGNLYGGGSFDDFGAIIAHNIVRRDGTQWHPLGEGVDARVTALVIDAQGRVYAGGDFTHAGGLPANHIAVWDGVQWQALEDGLNDIVYAVTVAPDGTLYAGGEFTATASSGVSLSYIARWDGQQWSEVGGGMDDQVWALLTDDEGNLYAGGSFDHAGGVAASHIAKWDGRQWSALGDGFDGNVTALIMAPDGTLYVGGWSERIITVEGHQEHLEGVAYWDGQQWRGLDDGLTQPPYVRSLAMDEQGNLYAGGYFTRITHGNVAASHVARWDGEHWQPMGLGMSITDAYGLYVSVNALVTDNQGQLFAGGLFNRAGGQAANYVACWDGMVWQPLDEGLSGPPPYRAKHIRAYAMTLVGNDRLFVGGYFDHAGEFSAVNVALWSWQPPTPVPTATPTVTPTPTITSTPTITPTPSPTPTVASRVFYLPLVLGRP